MLLKYVACSEDFQQRSAHEVAAIKNGLFAIPGMVHSYADQKEQGRHDHGTDPEGEQVRVLQAAVLVPDLDVSAVHETHTPDFAARDGGFDDQVNQVCNQCGCK